MSSTNIAILSVGEVSEAIRSVGRGIRTFHVSYQNHTADHSWLRALFVNQGESALQMVGKSSGTLGSTGIRRNNDDLIQIQMGTASCQRFS